MVSEAQLTRGTNYMTYKEAFARLFAYHEDALSFSLYSKLMMMITSFTSSLQYLHDIRGAAASRIMKMLCLSAYTSFTFSLYSTLMVVITSFTFSLQHLHDIRGAAASLIMKMLCLSAYPAR